jgi:hypothetical protein
LTQRKPVAARGLDLNDAARGSRSVERRRGGALYDLDALNVQRIEIRRARREDHAVHDEQRRVALTDAARRTQLDIDAVARLCGREDGDTGDLSLDRGYRVQGRHRNVFLRHASDGEWHFRTGSRVDDTGDHRFLEVERRP